MTVADDGKFFIPVDDFKIAFTSYAIGMYQDWTIAKETVTGTGQVFFKHLTSDVDQEVAITFDYQNPRQVETGCA